MSDELKILAEKARLENREKVLKILNGDEIILSVFDMFLIAEDPLPYEYLNGFLDALLLVGKIKDERDKNNLINIIYSHRNLLIL
ncbi:conserved domain protein [Haemophilus parainfluenzae ATCC 33392]|jgi:hypothetical protein|uniref:hypothetical protein n=1 Tax=Haemophilus parainfluenzae TaxID=729 RepID=UPI0004FFC25F|nr:hypothetical protein [Haemophilus parainfluenzae]KFL98623.1 conserved domain protein [Haemophilus parainfluenzae ATCC 33392]STP00278.1 Uncharacterised protein [Haemophilus parainfluenzae ATCC 33392]